MYSGKLPEVYYCVANFDDRTLNSYWKFCHNFQFTVLAISYNVANFIV